MSISPLDSVMWADLFGSTIARDTLGDTAMIAAMVETEIALAEACEAHGVTEKGSAAAIAAGLKDRKVLPQDLAEGAARDGVPVPALLSVLRQHLSPAEADALHWGATSQDIFDTATALCLGRFAAKLIARTEALCDRLAHLSAEHAETVQLARTRTQAAVPTTFGATLAGWGKGLVEAAASITASAEQVRTVSLYGAAGTDAAFGDLADRFRAEMADRLGLRADPAPWHTNRTRILAFAGAVMGLAAQAGRIGADIGFLASSGIGEVSLKGGGSSAMPHKVNPVRAEAAQSLARFAAHLHAAVSEAAIHRSHRDGAAWGLEWLSLQPLCASAAAAVENVDHALEGLTVHPEAMASTLKAAGIAPFSERLTYMIAETSTRADARRAVSAALAEADPLATLRAEYPDLDWKHATDPLAAAGNAPGQARAFAASRGVTT